MTNKQILTKAISKAVKNGWVWPRKQGSYNPEIILESFTNMEGNILRETYFEIIFSIDFAKHFWGDNYYQTCEDDVDTRLEFTEYEVENRSYFAGGYQLVWKYHLQQLVLEKEPLKYLEKHL